MPYAATLSKDTTGNIGHCMISGCPWDHSFVRSFVRSFVGSQGKKLSDEELDVAMAEMK